jgi:phosphomevalonate kinase
VSSVLASAPGKLLLTGEYAVLTGAPAILAAVDRRVHVRIRPAQGGRGRLTARPLGLVDEVTALSDDALVCPRRPDVDLGVTGRFVLRALAALSRPVGEAGGLEIEIDSRELFDVRDGHSIKLGLGSSAAVCAALARALATVFAPSCGQPDGIGLEAWLSAYRTALAGRASGADLAAALRGGVLVFAQEPETSSTSPVAWPAGLHWQPVWTGRAASSTAFVARFQQWRVRDPKAAASRLAELSDRARGAVDALGDARSFIDAASAYAHAIRELGAAMGCEIETDAHRRMNALAQRLGVVYKTCGAGGGDFGAALDTDPERLAAFAAEAARAGAVPVDLAVAAEGARAVASAEPGTGG